MFINAVKKNYSLNFLVQTLISQQQKIQSLLKLCCLRYHFVGFTTTTICLTSQLDVLDYATQTWPFIGGMEGFVPIWQVYKNVIKFGPAHEQNVEKLMEDFEKTPFMGWFFIIITLNLHFLNYLTLLRVCKNCLYNRSMQCYHCL